MKSRPAVRTRVSLLRRVSVALLILWPLIPLVAQTDPPRGVDQHDFPDSVNGCGPAAVLTLLRLSRPEHREVAASLLGGNDGVRMRFFTDRFLKGKPSLDHPGETRWGVHGVGDRDLAAGLNGLLAEQGHPSLSLSWLDRLENESAADHLRRVESLIADSLENGVTPILGLRSYVVRHRERRDYEPHWEVGVFHYVVVTELPGSPLEETFAASLLDPWGGRPTQILVHREPNGQNHSALRGTEANGNWLSGRPFLQVLAPDLPSIAPRDLKESDRIIVTAASLIGDF